MLSLENLPTAQLFSRLKDMPEFSALPFVKKTADRLSASRDFPSVFHKSLQEGCGALTAEDLAVLDRLSDLVGSYDLSAQLAVLNRFARCWRFSQRMRAAGRSGTGILCVRCAYLVGLLPRFWHYDGKGERKMDVDLIFRIAAVGIIVAVLNQILVRSGREEQAMMTTLAGLIVVLMMIVYEIRDLFDVIKSVFGL